jgi:guanylate kinase
MKVILAGKASSGKDHLARFLVEKGLVKSISFTTRPPRNNEKNGIDYNFTDKETFEQMISNDEFHEYELFNNNWYYGSTKKDLEKSNLFIKTPIGISKIPKHIRDIFYVIYIDIDEKTRRNRLIKRADIADSLERRLAADEKDFINFEDYDLRITDPNFNSNEIFKKINNLINDSIEC